MKKKIRLDDFTLADIAIRNHFREAHSLHSKLIKAGFGKEVTNAILPIATVTHNHPEIIEQGLKPFKK